MTVRRPTSLPSPVEWVDHNERVVGASHPTLADVDNRPLQELLGIAGHDSASNWYGLLGHLGAVSAVAYGDATVIGKINSAIADVLAKQAAGQTWFKYVWIPATMWYAGYDASTLTPTTAVQLVREGGSWSPGERDVVAYGADPTGVADAGPAWNAARASLPTTPAGGGGLVRVPSGTYKLTTAFSFGSQSNICLLLEPRVSLTGSALPAADYVNGNKIAGVWGYNFSDVQALKLGTTVQSNLGVMTSVAQYTLPAGALGVNGQQLRIRASGIPTVVSGQIQVKFGATAMIGAVVLPVNTVFKLDITVTRQTATAQTAEAMLLAYDSVAAPPLDTYVRGYATVPGETLASPVLIDIQALSTGAGGVMLVKSYSIERLHLGGT